MLQPRLSITSVQLDVSEWPRNMEHTPARQINAVYESAQRVTAIVVAVLSTAFTFLLMWGQIRPGGDLLGVILLGDSMTMAIICWGFALRGHIAESRRRTTSALLGGIMLGGIGFAAGYFGPLILSESNLGPLLGIFMTGPLGFVLGAIIGWLYARNRASKQKSS